jgi:hypothetical protein
MIQSNATIHSEIVVKIEEWYKNDNKF